MTRKEQICKQSGKYVKETHSPSSVSECQAAMNIAAMKSFVAGAQWADKTMLQEVLYWLEDATINNVDGCGYPIVSVTCCDNKEQMLQSFKERFNISEPGVYKVEVETSI